MDASLQLLELYEQWKSLTQREGAAILASDWTEVRRCQEKKQKLQPEIIHASEQMKKALRDGNDVEPRLRECINELIQLETNNSANLEVRIQAAKDEKDDLDRTSSRLKQIHKSYVPLQTSGWNHYS